MQNLSTPLHSWDTKYGKLQLSLGRDGHFIGSIRSKKVNLITEEWITGLPEEGKRDPERLKKWLSKTHVIVNNLDSNGMRLQVHPKLRGGMLGAVTAGASALSSTMKFFTSNNYVRLVREAGKQAQATLRVAGQECRATIEKAEEAAGQTINRANFAVNDCVQTAKNGTIQVLKTARRETEGVIAFGGIEARHTAKILELEVEKVLREAERTAAVTFARAGLEARQTIHEAGKETRETAVVVNDELNRTISHFSGETSGLISMCGQQIQESIRTMGEEALRVIHEGGDSLEQNVNQIIDNGIAQIETLTTKTLDQMGLLTKEIISQVSTEINGIILNAGEQGRLLIRESGEEFQYRASNVLADAARHSEILISTAGIEGRLLIEEAGKMVRCTLKQIPEIAGKTARQLGRNLVVGFREGLGIFSDLQQIDNAIRNYCDTAADDSADASAKSFENLLQFIVDQHQLNNPKNKASLYRTLVMAMNIPSIPDHIRRIYFIMIGSTACDDFDLYQRGGLFSSEYHYSEEIIDALPGEAQSIVREHRTKAMDIFIVPEQVPIVSDQTEEEIELQMREQKEREEALTLENERSSVRLLQEKNQIESTEAKESRQETEKLRQELLASRHALEESNRILQELQQTLKDLQEQNLQREALYQQQSTKIRALEDDLKFEREKKG